MVEQKGIENWKEKVMRMRMSARNGELTKEDGKIRRMKGNEELEEDGSMRLNRRKGRARMRRRKKALNRIRGLQ